MSPVPSHGRMVGTENPRETTSGGSQHAGEMTALTKESGLVTYVVLRRHGAHDIYGVYGLHSLSDLRS